MVLGIPMGYGSGWDYNPEDYPYREGTHEECSNYDRYDSREDRRNEKQTRNYDNGHMGYRNDGYSMDEDCPNYEYRVSGNDRSSNNHHSDRMNGGHHGRRNRR